MAVLLVPILVGSVMAVGPLASSPTPAESTDQSTTYLRVAHASADAPPVDVYLDNDSVVTNASFGDVTDYLTLEAGTYNLTVTEAGDREAVVFEDNVTLAPRTPTTVAASGGVTEGVEPAFAPRAFTDDPFAPGANDSAVRVVHLSADAPEVDVTTANGTVVLAENVSFGNASDYVTVPAGDYELEIREASAGNNGTIVETVNVSLDGGVAYTGWAVGLLEADDDEEAFTVGLTEDATVTVHLPTEHMTETPEGTATATDDGTGTATDDGTPTASPGGTDTDAGNQTDDDSTSPTATETP